MAEQRSEAWLIERLGHITGSRFDEVIAKDRTGKKYLGSRKAVITEVVLELITGKPGPMWSSKATRWGTEQEPNARMLYEARTGYLCEEVGFITHPRHMQIGCSPDGLIDRDGGYEAKCPYTAAVHMDTLINGMPPEHMAQVQGGMSCAERDWWDFVSYHPAFPEGMQLYIQRIPRDQNFIDEMENSILDAIAEININVRTLLEQYGAKQ